MKALLYFIIIVVAAALAMFFAVLNPGDIEVNLYYTQFKLPLAAAVIVSMFFGVLLGFIVSAMGLLSRGSKIRKLNRKLRDAQTELNLLRKQPIEES